MIPQHYQYNDGSATDNKIKLIIPILIMWARTSWDKIHYYGDVAKMIDCNPQSVGDWLGLIWSHVIHPRFPYAPSLNALVSKQGTDLPSDGLDYVFPEYSKLSSDKQRALVYKANEAAHKYDWNPVLTELGLKPLPIMPDKEMDKYVLSLYTKSLKKSGRKGGESIYHKKIKEYIAVHPEAVGITDELTFLGQEFTILSQDRIDILFQTKNNYYAVEVKSEISDDDDLIRGVFQAVKYQAVLEAQGKVNGCTNEVHSILVIGRELTDLARSMANVLDVTVIENFKIPE